MAPTVQADDFVCINDFEINAVNSLGKKALDYYKSGANNEETLEENRKAFSRLRLRPRFLRNVSKRNLTTSILGHTISFPIGISPTAMQKMAHPDGEIASARAAAAAGTVFILSTIATSSIEEVSKRSPCGLRWFQLYIYRDREVTKQLVLRAEKWGYEALVLTVDTPYFGHRLADTRNKFSLPPHLRMANFGEHDIRAYGVREAKNESGLNEYASSLFDPSITWKDVEWLNNISTLPIVLKGILTAEDAILAVQHGAAGILVSNHGARQLDGVPATIEALPEVVRAVAGRCEVYLDGGVRTGTDVLKAMALGAKAVFIGRPILWGLSHSGETGVQKVLEILKKELDMAMGLAGREDGKHIQSVGLLLSRHTSDALLGYECINERFLTAKYQTSIKDLNVICCYDPTKDDDEDEKDRFYGQLQDILNSVKKGDITLVTLVLVDYNAKVGTDSDHWGGVIGSLVLVAAMTMGNVSYRLFRYQ